MQPHSPTAELLLECSSRPHAAVSNGVACGGGVAKTHLCRALLIEAAIARTFQKQVAYFLPKYRTAVDYAWLQTLDTATLEAAVVAQLGMSVEGYINANLPASESKTSTCDVKTSSIDVHS